MLIGVFAGTAHAETDIVLVGGWGSNEEQMQFLKEKLKPKELVIPESSWDIAVSAEEIYHSLQRKGIKRAVFVAHSWGGLITRQIAAKHPDMVSKMILIGTPNAGYRNLIIPDFIFKVTGLERQDIPLYIIAGSKGSSKWFMKDELNDGTVELDSVFSVASRRPISDSRIFPLNHVELLQSDEVAAQILLWINQ